MSKSKVIGQRAMLNLPGHHSTASIVAEVVMHDRWPDATVAISDCGRKITLEFTPSDVNTHENDLYKVDTMISALRAFRRGLVKAQKQCTS